MHTTRNKLFFFGSTLAAGLCSLGLHRYMMDSFLDSKGLLISGNLPGRLLILVGLLFAGALLWKLRGLGGDGTYADNFPKNTASGLLMIAAGVVLAAAAPGLMQPAAPGAELVAWARLFEQLTDAAMTALPWLAAVSMAVLGLFRMKGRKPAPWFSGVVCLFYMMLLVTNYRLWSADPQLQDYAYQLLAGVLLMLCSFHRTCCDAGIIQRKKLVITGLLAAVCCMASISMPFQQQFYLASALWSAGCICLPAVLPPDPEPEPEPEEEAPGADEE